MTATILTESVAICRYLEGLHPTPNLFGETLLEQAQIEMWNRRIELQLFDSIGQMARHSFTFFADKIEQIPEHAEAQWRRFEQVWHWLDNELADGRPFVAGERFSIADITGMAVLLVCQVCSKDTAAGCQTCLPLGRCTAVPPQLRRPTSQSRLTRLQ